MPTRQDGSASKNASIWLRRSLAGVDPVNLEHVLGDIQTDALWHVHIIFGVMGKSRPAGNAGYGFGYNRSSGSEETPWPYLN